MRVTAEIPPWMIADGEYAGVAVGRRQEFGFALVPASIQGRTADRGLHQVDGSSATTASGVVLRHSSDVPPVLDEGCVLPILAAADLAHPAGAELDVDGRLVLEPFLWAPDGLLWPTVPDGVRLWSVRGISQLINGTSTGLDSVPPAEAVDHAARYLVWLERP